MEANVYFKRGHGVDFDAQAPEGYILVRIPFPGFYESRFSAELESAVEYEEESGVDVGAKYSDVYIEEDDVGSRWLDAIKGICSLREPVYAGIWRPKEYNFITDRLFAYVKYDDLLLMIAGCDKDKLDAAVKEATTSRPGYMPYHKKEDATWKEDMPVALWTLVFECLLDTNSISMFDVYEAAFTEESKPLSELVHWVERRPEPQEQEAS